MLKPKLDQATNKEADALLAEEQDETRTDRTNFSDEVKAKIFARDRAICGFTGLNLWLLDDGACGFYNSAWIDHITPSTKGGLSTEDNGIATHWAWNYEKGDNANSNIYLFNGGFPTMNFWAFNHGLTIEMAQRIVRFEEMHPSDFYFNRALGCFLGGVMWLHSGKSGGYKRDDAYFAVTCSPK